MDDSLTHLLLQGLDAEYYWFRTETILPIMIFSIPIVAIIAHYWHRTIKTRSENELKRQMIDQGMSADEIERVLAARGPEDECDRRKRLRRDGAGKV